MNPNKEVCRRFLVVFREGTESLDTVDEKLKHHADGLTSAVKLLKSAPDSTEIKNMWKGLISSTINMMLDLSDPPSKPGLQQFVETVKPWLITSEYKSYCHAILMDVYKMAEDEPWSSLPFRNLLSKEVTDPQELMESFNEEPNFPAQRLRALYMSSNKDSFVLFGCAMLLHPTVKLNKEFQKLFQRSVNSFLQITEVREIVKYFNLQVTCEVLDELTDQDENAENLCTGVMEYLWENESMEQLENLTTRWCQIISMRTSEDSLYEEVRNCFEESKEKIRSVQQCIILASTLWKVFPSKSRYVCVEILHEALTLLKPDDVNHGQIESGILSSMIYFLPNSQVARYCTLTLFIRNPTPESYFEVAKSYRMKHRETTNDRKDKFESLKVLDHLHARWPPEFMLCTNWAWMRLRKLCLETMKSDDAAYVQQVEKEEAEKSLGEEIKVDNKRSQSPQTEPLDSTVDSSCNTTGVSDSDASDVVRTDSSDPCDCLVCALKQANGQHIPHHHSGSCPLKSTPKPAPTKGNSPQPLSPLPGEVEGSWICPEETCRRLFRSKAGITRHLNTKHMWMSAEIGAFYESLGTQEKSNKTRTSRSDFIGKTATLSVDNVISVDSAEPSSLEPIADVPINVPADSLKENGEVTEPSSEAAGSSNFMHSSAKQTTTEKPISLPPIFPKDKPSIEEAPETALEAQTKNIAPPSQTPEIECPVESCTRTFRHRHTVQAHIEFRHKIKPGKAKKLAESAKFIPGPPPSNLLRQNPPKTDNSIDVIDICKSRGWYMMVDDFLYDEAEETTPGFQSLYRRQDLTLKSSLARDVICLFGNAPSSFDLAESQFNIEKHWQIQSVVSEPASEPIAEAGEPDDGFEDDMMIRDSFQFDHYDPDVIVEAEPPPITRKLADISLMTMEVHLKQSQEVPPPKRVTSPVQKEPTQESRFNLDQGKAFTNVYCQTEITSADNHKFSEQEHYHVCAAGRVRPKKKQSMVACTVISAGYLGKPSRTLGLQCCQDKDMIDGRKGSKQVLTSDKAKQKILKPKGKTEPSVASVPVKPKVKRRYDIQTLYQMAEKYKDLEPIPTVGNDATSRSFEDALNYSAPAVLLAEREKLISKARKKSLSSGSESKNRKEVDAAKKAAPIQEKSSKNKKTKTTATSSSSSSGASTLGKRSAWIHPEPVEVAKRRKSDGAEELSKRRKSEEEVKPSTNYQELLKQAEQLNARPKPMLQVRKHKPSTATPQPQPKIVRSEDKIANSNTKAPKAAPLVVKRKSLPSLGSNRQTPESKMPAPMSTERPPGKPPSKKRRISLRSLSSMVERMETAPSADSSQSFEDSFVASETDSLFSQGSRERSPSSVDTTLDSSDGQPLAEKVFCSKCNKQLKSAFALACHMRKRHKGQSKIFYPTQAISDAGGNTTSNSSNGSKNSVEPPEEIGAGNENTQVADQVAPNIDSAPVFNSTLSSLEDLGSCASQESTFPHDDQPTRCSTPKLGDSDSTNAEKCFTEFEQHDGLIYCKVDDCTSKFKLRSSLLRHCKKKHPEKYNPNSRRHSLNRSLGRAKRNAFKQAAYQIQADAWHPSKRKGDIIIQELMMLYNKRANKRIAMSLSAAPKPSRIEVPQESECQSEPTNVISPCVSTDSVDSFKADFDANLPCWHCKEMFHCRRNLTTHIQHHLRLIDSYKFRCTFQGCLYAFSTKEDLADHKPRHDHSRCHLCLFCPNYSSVFRAAKQLLLHEHSAHSNIKVKLDKLRKQFCFKQFASVSIPKSLPPLEDNTNTLEERPPKNDSFLSLGHRSLPATQAAQAVRTPEAVGGSGACGTTPRQASVAIPAPKEHRKVENGPGEVLDDLLCAVSEYLLLPQFEENDAKQAVSSWPKVTAKVPCNADLPFLDTADKNLTKPSKTSGRRRSKSVEQNVDVSETHSPEAVLNPAEIQHDSSEILLSSEQTPSLSLSSVEESAFDLKDSNSRSEQRKRRISSTSSANQSVRRPYVVRWTNCANQAEPEFEDDNYSAFSPECPTSPLSTPSPILSPQNGLNHSKTSAKGSEVAGSPTNQTTSTTVESNGICDFVSDSEDSVSVKTSTSGYFPCEDNQLLENASLDVESNIVAINSMESTNAQEPTTEVPHLNPETTGLNEETLTVECSDLETPSLQQEVFLATENTDHSFTRIYDAVHDITAHIKDLSASDCADNTSLESISTHDPTEDNLSASEQEMLNENDTDNDVFNGSKTCSSNIRDEDTICVESAPDSPIHNNGGLESNSHHTFSQPEPELSNSELPKTLVHEQAIGDACLSDSFDGVASYSGLDDVENLVCGEVLHKLLCDVEIAEQVFFFRCCGMVPTSVLYYNCCDLQTNPASGVSVQGYKTEAFVAMELAQQALSSYAQQQNAQAGGLRAIETADQGSEELTAPKLQQAKDVIGDQRQIETEPDTGKTQPTADAIINIGEDNETVSTTNFSGTNQCSDELPQTEEFNATPVKASNTSSAANVQVEQQQIEIDAKSESEKPSFVQTDKAVLHSVQQSLPITDQDCGERVTIESDKSSNSDLIDVETYIDSPGGLENQTKTPFIADETQQGSPIQTTGTLDLSLPLNNVEIGEIVVEQQDTLLPESRHEISPSELSPSCAEDEEVAIAESLLNLGRLPGTEEAASSRNESPQETQLSPPENHQNQITPFVDSIESISNGNIESPSENLQNQINPFGQSLESYFDANTPSLSKNLQNQVPTFVDSIATSSNADMPSLSENIERQNTPFVDSVERNSNGNFESPSQKLQNQIQPFVQTFESNSHLNPVGVSSFLQTGLPTDPNWSIQNSHMACMAFAQSHPMWTIDAKQTYSELSMADLSTMPIMQRLLFCQYNVVTNPRFGVDHSHLSGFISRYPVFSDEAQSLAFHAKPRAAEISIQGDLETLAPAEDAIQNGLVSDLNLLTTENALLLANQNSEHYEETTMPSSHDTNTDTNALNTTSPSSKPSTSAVGELELSGSLLDSADNDENQVGEQLSVQNGEQISTCQTLQNSPENAAHMEVNNEEQKSTDNTLIENSTENEVEETFSKETEENHQEKPDPLGLKENDDEHGDFFLKDFIEDFKKELRLPRNGKKFKQARSSLPSMFKVRNRPSVGFNKKYMKREMSKKMSMEDIVALHETLSEPAPDEKEKQKEERKRLRAEKKRLKTEKREAEMLAKHRKLQLKMMAEKQESLQAASLAQSDSNSADAPIIIASSPPVSADNVARAQAAENQPLQNANSAETLLEGRKRPRKQVYAKKRKSGVKRGSLVFFKSPATASAKQNEHKGDLPNVASRTVKKRADSLDEKLKKIKLMNLTLVPMLNRLDLEYPQEGTEPLASQQNSSEMSLKSPTTPVLASSAKTVSDINQRSSPITMTVPFAQKSYSIQFHNQQQAASDETAKYNTQSQKHFVQSVPTATVNPIASKKAVHKATLVLPSPSELSDLYLCSMCNTKVKGMSAYISHLNVRHIFCVKQFACRKKHATMCFRSYKTLEELEEHMKEHEMTNSFPCLLCRLWFASRTEVTSHLNKDHQTLYSMWLRHISDVRRRSQKPAQLAIKSSGTTALPNSTADSQPTKNQQFMPHLIDSSYKQKYNIGDSKIQPRKSPPQKACKASNIRVRTPPISFKPLHQTQPPKDANIQQKQLLHQLQQQQQLQQQLQQQQLQQQQHQQQQKYQFSSSFGQSSQPVSRLSQLLLKPSSSIQNQLLQVKKAATKNRFSAQNLNRVAFKSSPLPRSSAKQNSPKQPQLAQEKTQAILFPSIPLKMLENLKKSSSVGQQQPIGTDQASPANSNSGLIIEPTPAMFNTYVHDSPSSNTITVPLQSFSTPGHPVIGQVPVQSEPASVQNTWQRRPTISLDLLQNHTVKTTAPFRQEVAASSKAIDFLNTTKSFAIVAPTVRAVSALANSQQNQGVFRSKQNTPYHQRRQSFTSIETSALYNSSLSSDFTIPQTSYSTVPATTQSSNALSYYLAGQKLKQAATGQLTQIPYGFFDHPLNNQQPSNHTQTSKHQSSQLANYAGLKPTSCRGIFQITPPQRSRSLSLPTSSTHLQHFTASSSLSSGSTQQRTGSSEFAPSSAIIRKAYDVAEHSIVSSHKLPAHQKSQEKKLFINLEEDNSETCLAECEFCNNIYSTFFDLLTHMKDEHNLSLCPIPKCGQTFASSDDVCDHCSRNHDILQRMSPHAQRLWIERNIYFSETLPSTTSPGKDSAASQEISSDEDTTTKNHRIAGEIWRQKTTKYLKDDHRQKLTTFFELVDGTEDILPSVFFEVKTYCERCVSHCDKDSEFHKCPLKHCVVFGSKRNLYYHILQQHELEKILDWVRKRIKDICRKNRKRVKIVNPEPILIEDSDSNSRSPPKTNAIKENAARDSSTDLDGSFISQHSTLTSPEQQSSQTSQQPNFDSQLSSSLAQLIAHKSNESQTQRHTTSCDVIEQNSDVTCAIPRIDDVTGQKWQEVVQLIAQKSNESQTTQRPLTSRDVIEQTNDVTWTIPRVDDVTEQKWQEVPPPGPKNSSPPPKTLPTLPEENRYSDIIRISPPAGGTPLAPADPPGVVPPSKEYPTLCHMVASPVKPKPSVELEIQRQSGAPKPAERRSTSEIVRQQLAELFGRKRFVQTPPTSAGTKRTSPNQALTVKKARLVSPKPQNRCESPFLISDEPKSVPNSPKQDTPKNSRQNSVSVPKMTPPTSSPEKRVQGLFDNILEKLVSEQTLSQSDVSIVVGGDSPEGSSRDVETPKKTPSPAESRSAAENGPKIVAKRPEMALNIERESANTTTVSKAAIGKTNSVSQLPRVYSFEPLVLLKSSEINNLPKKATFKQLPRTFKCRFHKCKRSIFGRQAMSEHMYGHVIPGKTAYHEQDGRYWPIFDSLVHITRIDTSPYRRQARRFGETETWQQQLQQFCATKPNPEIPAKPTSDVIASEMIYHNMKLPCVLLKKVVTT